jgi:hypothetical protein
MQHSSRFGQRVDWSRATCTNMRGAYAAGVWPFAAAGMLPAAPPGSYQKVGGVWIDGVADSSPSQMADRLSRTVSDVRL